MAETRTMRVVGQAVRARTRSSKTYLLCPVDHKISYRTANLARERALHDIKEGRTATAATPYKCKHCPYFHLTSGSVSRNTPDFAVLHSRLGIALLAIESLGKNPGRSASRVERELEELRAVDREVRLVEGSTSGIDRLRSDCVRVLRDVPPRFQRLANTLADEMVPMAMATETWGWVTSARSRLIEAAEQACRGEVEPIVLMNAFEGYATVLDQHVIAQSLPRRQAYMSEFELLSDVTADAVEHAPAGPQVDLLVELLLTMEDLAVRELVGAHGAARNED